MKVASENDFQFYGQDISPPSSAVLVALNLVLGFRECFLSKKLQTKTLS